MENFIDTIIAALNLQSDVIKELQAKIDELNKKVENNTRELEYIRKTY